MLGVLFYIYIFTFEIVTIINVYVLLQVLKQMKIQNGQKQTTTNKRVHSTIKTSNYSNPYGNRAYDIYKDKKTGLYEPQKPHQGIELKNKKED